MPHNRSMPDCLSSLLLRAWCTVPGSQSDTRLLRRGRAGSTDSRPRRARLPVRRAPAATPGSGGVAQLVRVVPGSQCDTRPLRRGRAGSTDSRPRRARLPVRRAPAATPGSAGLAPLVRVMPGSQRAYCDTACAPSPTSRFTIPSRHNWCVRSAHCRSGASVGVFHRRTTVQRSRAGGRQPPVASKRTGGKRALRCKRLRTSESGAAGVSQPWFECRTCAGNVITPHYASLVPHRSPGVGHVRETQSPRDRRSPLQTRFASHGGLTPAAPGNVRSCIAKGVFPPADVRTPTQERGGVSPPWGAFRMRTHQSRCTPRGGAEGVRPGGMHSVHANAKSGNSSHCICRSGLPSHGGLTPAAPVDVRLCIVEGDFFSQRKSCTKSGWRA
jgi:hypothetical protein